MQPTDIQQALGLVFNDLSLLRRALTHRSYLNENPNHHLEDNERLEFLGDAVLDFVVGDHLYNRFPDMHEGELTNLRAALVRTQTLARFAAQIELGNYLWLGKGEEESGGRTRGTMLCDAFEALIGAIYLDQGMAAVLEFTRPFFLPEIERVRRNKSDRDPKSLFQELAQGAYKITPSYKAVDESGPDHEKTFIVGVFLNNVCYGQGRGASKQQAQQKAAAHGLHRLQYELENQS